MQPMVHRVCDQNRDRRITREVLDEMVDEIYDIMEPEETRSTEAVDAPVLKNGDVVNPNISQNTALKETGETRSSRNRNFLMRDFITVMLLSNMISPNRPHHRPCYCHPGRPCNCRPHHPGRPPHHHRMCMPWPGATY